MSDATLQVRKLGLHPGAVIGVCALTAVAGAALGWGADALFGWFQQTFDSAPALLRAAAALPEAITIAALAVAGLAFGLMIVGDWEGETLVCEIRPDGVQTRLQKRTAWVERGRIASAFVDGEELVLADARGRMLAVGKVDGVGPRRVGRAFAEAGYPWADGGHPLERAFSPFVEGRDDLGEVATPLLRARATALEDGQKARARDLRAELSQAGVLVRDRRGAQEYARLPGSSRH
ncbi:YqeB family protein [Pseudactinotalea sp.]|uniref:YqeB family protein n=1 Tax=Pseudactinotalea sp. TaxID=1926260 RepID=UPI003B3B36E3